MTTKPIRFENLPLNSLLAVSYARIEAKRAIGQASPLEEVIPSKSVCCARCEQALWLYDDSMEGGYTSFCKVTSRISWESKTNKGIGDNGMSCSELLDQINRKNAEAAEKQELASRSEDRPRPQAEPSRSRTL